MFNKFKEGFQSASDTLKEQVNALGDAAKAKGYSIIDQWVGILHTMEEYGLEITYFAMSMSISPELGIEMTGKVEDFSYEKIDEILEAHKGNTPITLVFSAVKTTLQWHQKSHTGELNPLVVKINVGLSPEIKVAIGAPLLE